MFWGLRKEWTWEWIDWVVDESWGLWKDLIFCGLSWETFDLIALNKVIMEVFSVEVETD